MKMSIWGEEMRKKLTKSRSNIVISGVLGGLGEYLNIDPTILRVIFIIVTFFGAGTPAVLYFILMLVMPADRRSYPTGDQRYQNYHSYNSNRKETSQRKEAEKVNDDDEWSDF